MTDIDKSVGELMGEERAAFDLWAGNWGAMNAQHRCAAWESWQARAALQSAKAPGVFSIDELMRDCQQARAAALPYHRVADIGFRWDGERQEHVPNLLIEFQPVPANSPNTAKGWKDRDALAAMLSAAPKAQADHSGASTEMAPAKAQELPANLVEAMDDLCADFHKYQDGDQSMPFVVLRDSIIAALTEWQDNRAAIRARGQS